MSDIRLSLPAIVDHFSGENENLMNVYEEWKPLTDITVTFPHMQQNTSI